MHDDVSKTSEVAAIEQLLQRRPAVRHILRLRLLGKSRKEIATILGKSPHTIDWHLRELVRSCQTLSLVRIVVIIAGCPRLTTLVSGSAPPPRFQGVPTIALTHNAKLVRRSTIGRAQLPTLHGGRSYACTSGESEEGRSPACARQSGRSAQSVWSAPSG